MQNEARLKLKMDVPGNVWKIKQKLNDNGYKLYIVGGAVRDALMGRKPKDYDLATDATYETIRELFTGENYVKNLLTIGEKFAINFLVTTDGDYELATFRSDVSGGRKSTVQYEKSLEKDVQRRDFTMNALAYDLDSGEVVDYVGGIEDIKNGFINAVGDAEARFLDDPLRKLRAVRFAARTGNKLSPETEKALLNSNSMVDVEGEIVSLERRKDEFQKGIKAAISVVNFLNLLEKYKLFEKIFEKKGIEINPKYFVEERNFVVLVANIIQDSVKRIGIQGIENALTDLKYSVKKGDKEIPRISFLLYILQSWQTKSFQKENSFEFFNKLKSLYKKIEEFAKEDLVEFAKLNGIDQKYINALFVYFVNELTEEDKLSVAKTAGTDKGPEYGTALKKKDFESFQQAFGINKEKEDNNAPLGEPIEEIKGVNLETVKEVYVSLFKKQGITLRDLEIVRGNGFSDMVFKLPGTIYYAVRWYAGQNDLVYSRFLKDEVKAAQDELDSSDEVKKKDIKVQSLQNPNAETLVDALVDDYKRLLKSNSFLSKLSNWLLQ